MVRSNMAEPLPAYERHISSLRLIVAITYDPAKREATLSQRGLDFHDANLVFAGPTISFEDNRTDYGEPRNVTVGLLRARMVIVIWTPRGDDNHVISMRKANAREQAK